MVPIQWTHSFDSHLRIGFALPKQQHIGLMLKGTLIAWLLLVTAAARAEPALERAWQLAQAPARQGQSPVQTPLQQGQPTAQTAPGAVGETGW